MKRSMLVCAVCAVFFFPALSMADCSSATLDCENAKGLAHKCSLTYGFRASVACADKDKAAETACAQAEKICTGSQSTTAPATRRNQ